ncbi:MAG: ROK family protein [Candidatus Peribacteraceae bacterium]|nr:ROK family protein [Candidatus Peribacteraceae bacterium]
MPSLLGIDLGGTKIAAARYDATTWKMQDSVVEDTCAGESFSKVLQRIVARAKSLIVKDTASVGIGVPGFVERPTGIIRTLPNISGAENVRLKSHMEEVLKLPVTVDNDVTCFTLAEALRGAGNGLSIVVGITMGTGVGGGIVIDGVPYHGSHGFAAEFGHMLLRPNDLPYPTEDRRGDVEQFLSGSAFAKRCTAAKRPEEYLQGEVCAFLQPQVFEETAQLCASLIHCLDPDIIVFGGSVGRALKPHLKEVEKQLTHWVYHGTPLPVLAVARLKDAGTLGAAMIAEEAA